MLWVLYSLLSAFGWATADVFTKKASDVDDYILMLSRFLFGVPFVVLFLFFIPIPILDSNYWILLFFAIALETIVWILYVKAIKNSPLSLVVPFLSLTPVFLVFTSFIILGELPTTIGFFGILMIAFGAYVLNFKNLGKGILDPFKSIFKERGIVYMIIAAFLFSILANLFKILILKSSAMFLAAIYFPLMVVPLLVIAYFKSRKNLIQLKTNFKGLFPIGLFFALMIIFNNLAIRLVIVPYMISIKRTSSIFSVLYGHFLFKEKDIKARFVGTIIMLIGAGLIILS